MCKERHWGIVEVESDSERACDDSSAFDIALEIYVLSPQDMQSYGGGFKLQHIYRQANKVADGLAIVGHEVNARIEFNELEAVWRNIQKLLFSDRIGFPYFRPKCH